MALRAARWPLAPLLGLGPVPVLQRRLASGPSGAGAVRSDSPRLHEPCEAMLEALGEIGVAEAPVLPAALGLKQLRNTSMSAWNGASARPSKPAGQQQTHAYTH